MRLVMGFICQQVAGSNYNRPRFRISSIFNVLHDVRRREMRRRGQNLAAARLLAGHLGIVEIPAWIYEPQSRHLETSRRLVFQRDVMDAFRWFLGGAMGALAGRGTLRTLE